MRIFKNSYFVKVMVKPIKGNIKRINIKTAFISNELFSFKTIYFLCGIVLCITMWILFSLLI